ncbi:signal recognition particle 9 kDa protein-domain-containing protein [Phaeosphaeria sp. MPI-PUGE-AT-0046c]|nr:signal recognition particle 9 kDa protein-domain-containing protein [Phaeosphaeria sp. MPI-PUGE-AT-0046c]
MPYFKTSAEWYEQSSLLLKARPTSTRITSKYTVLKPSASKIQKRQKYAAKQPTKSTDAARASSPTPQSQDPEEPTTTFTIKTYDPESGTCLQYETNKAAEVGRLIGNLGRLGREMAALPEVVDDLSAPTETGNGVSTPRLDEGGDVKMGGVPSDPKAGAGGKKKKKGKK